jgi:hypothetical protein
MGTMTFSIASPAGSRQKVFTFPDTASTAIINAAKNLYPAATVSDSLDMWFTDYMHRMTDQVLANQRGVASATAAAGVADIPIT